MKPKQKPEKQTPAPAIRDPDSCPFCNKRRLAPSSSGKHLVCQKCGRIVVSGWPATWPLREKAKRPNQ